MDNAKKYYAKLKKMTVSVPVLGDNGKPMFAKNPNGDFRRKPNGEKIPMLKLVMFNTVSGNPKMGFMSILETEDENLQAVLDNLVDSPSSPVLNEDMYKQSVNAAAWQAEKKLRAVEIERDDKQSTIEAQAEQLKEMKDELDLLTAPAPDESASMHQPVDGEDVVEENTNPEE